MITEDSVRREKTLILESLATSPIDAPKAFIAASGLTDKEAIIEYNGRLNKIHSDFEKFSVESATVDSSIHEQLKGAKNLFDYLHTKGKHIGSHETSFHIAIDNCLNPMVQKIGCCWSVAALFYVLGEKSSLPLQLSYSPNVGHGRIQIPVDKGIAIDPIFGSGFDVGKYPDEEILPLQDFVSMAYLNRTDIATDPTEKALLCLTAIELSPQRAEGYGELATVHIEHGGDYSLAIQLCHRAMELGKNHPIYRTNLAAAYHRMGKNALALDELKKIKEEYPNFKHADTLIQRIMKIELK